MSTQTLVSITNADRSPLATPGLAELERQVGRGQLFAQSVLGENSVRLGEVEVLLHGLIDTLLAKGIAGEAEILAAAQNVRSELIERNELNRARTMVRLETPEENLQPPAEVDCRSRLHICHAVCCKLDFALSIPEVESGKVKWDLGRPYFIRHDEHGTCAHLNSENGACRIYDNRPSVCRGYSCASDRRIWNDFEKMELNQDWIDAHVSQGSEPRMILALMRGESCVTNTVLPDEAGQGNGHV